MRYSRNWCGLRQLGYTTISEPGNSATSETAQTAEKPCCRDRRRPLRSSPAALSAPDYRSHVRRRIRRSGGGEFRGMRRACRGQSTRSTKSIGEPNRASKRSSSKRRWFERRSRFGSLASRSRISVSTGSRDDRLRFARWHRGQCRCCEGLCRSSRSPFVLRTKRIPLTIDHLAVLCDRHIDAGAAFSIG